MKVLIDAETDNILHFRQSSHYNEALRTACIMNQYEDVKSLLKRSDININFQDNVGGLLLNS